MSSSDNGAEDRLGEAELLQRIREYRRDYRTKRRSELMMEMERRREKGEILYAGHWIARDKLARARRRLARHDRIVFLETFVAIVLCFLLTLFFWRLFGFLFLPGVEKFLP